jgi:4'-phosphopantetheinyl transferase
VVATPPLSALAAPAHPALEGIELWALDATGADVEALARQLSPAERAVALRTAPTAPARTRARAFAAGRVALRALLAERGADPAAPFVTGEHGRPALESGPAFAVSYAGATVILALAGEGDIGVDVERPRGGAAAPDALARGAGFSAAEVAAVGADPARFLRLWTLKEALAKAAGTGIGSRAWALELRCDDAPQEVAGPGGARGVVAGVPGPAGHTVAVARWRAVSGA